MVTIFLCTLGYFSSMAKVINTWRDKGRNMYQWCNELFGPVLATRCAKISPPRCLIGRWGSEFNTAGRILAFEPAQLVALWEQMQHDKKRARPAPPVPGGDDDPTPLDEHMQDEIEHRRAKNSKWYTESFAAIRAPAWWCTLRISYRVRKVFHDLQSPIQSHSKICPEEGWNDPGCIALLVWGHAEQF